MYRLIIALLFLAGCQPGADLPSLDAAQADQEYHLSASDQIRVTTFGEATLSGDFAIDDNGYVALPLLGRVAADGLTSSGLAERISQGLRSRKVMTDPNVVVEVTRYRPVYVLGEVQHPGPFPYQARMTLLQAVSLAGGFTPRAVKSRAEIIRVVAKQTVKGQLDAIGRVEPGDVITVLERNF